MFSPLFLTILRTSGFWKFPCGLLLSFSLPFASACCSSVVLPRLFLHLLLLLFFLFLVPVNFLLLFFLLLLLLILHLLLFLLLVVLFLCFFSCSCCACYPVMCRMSSPPVLERTATGTVWCPFLSILVPHCCLDRSRERASFSQRTIESWIEDLPQFHSKSSQNPYKILPNPSGNLPKASPKPSPNPSLEGSREGVAKYLPNSSILDSIWCPFGFPGRPFSSHFQWKKPLKNQSFFWYIFSLILASIWESKCLPKPSKNHWKINWTSVWKIHECLDRFGHGFLNDVCFIF